MGIIFQEAGPFRKKGKGTPMSQEKGRDFIQNIIITVLFLLAVALFAKTQMESLGLDERTFNPAAPPVDSGAAASAPALSAPVRIAITGAYGRYGSLTLSTASEEFDAHLGRCLSEALGSAQGFMGCTEEEFLTALEGPSVYYDFLEPLPLSILASLAGGGEGAPEDISARRLVIAGQGDGTAALYLWGSPGSCWRCSTALSAGSVEQAAGQYELGGTHFARDLGLDTAPCSLFLEELPVLPVLKSEDPLGDTDWLLTALGFNPRTRTRYVDASGTEMIMDGERSLRILASKTVSYQSGGDPALAVQAEDDVPTLQEAALGAGEILNRLTASLSSDAAFYLQSIRQDGEATFLCFGCQVGGIPIRIPGGSAVEMTLTGCSVTALTLRLRTYSLTEEPSLLLPLRQALAIAASRPGAELSIAYVDRTNGCPASWIVD